MPLLAPVYVSWVLCAILRGTEPDAPPPGTVFPIFIRPEHPPAPEEKAILAKTGITGYVVAADDPDLAAFARDPVPLLLDRAADRGELCWRMSEYERWFEEYLVTRDPAATARTNCPRREPAASELKKRVAVAVASRGGSILGISLAHDPSWAHDSDPSDSCMCSDCIAAWRRDLATRFPDARAAAVALGLEGDDFEKLEPWGVDRVRAWNESQPRSRTHLGAWLDYRRFLDRSMTTMLSDLASAARGDSSTYTGFLGGTLPNPFSGIDWSQLPRVLTLVCPPRDPTSSEIAYSIHRPDGIVLLPLHPMPGQAIGDLRLSRRVIAEQFFAGARGGIVDRPEAWFEDKPVGDGKSTAIVASDFARAVADVAKFFVTVGAHEWAAARPVPPRAAILYSARSLKIQWLIDAEPDGIYWPTRAARLEGELLPLARDWWGWQLVLSDIGVPYRYLADEDIDDPKAKDPLANVSVLVVPRVIAMSAIAAERIRTFVENGGRVLADGECGLYDENGNGLERGRLDDLFGVTRKASTAPWDALRPGSEPRNVGSVESIRQLESDVEVAPAADSRAIRFNRNFGDYVLLREHENDSAQELRSRVRAAVAGKGGLRIPFSVHRASGPEQANVRVFEAQANGGRLFGIVRTELTLEPANAKDAASPDPRDDYSIEFDHAVFIDDLVTGATATEAANRGKITLPVDGFALLRVREP